MWSGFNSQSVHENKLQENRFITITPSYQENTEGRDRSRGIAHDYLLRPNHCKYLDLALAQVHNKYIMECSTHVGGPG